MTSAVITNGQSAVDLLDQAGIGDLLLSWDDTLHDGPVPPTDDLAALVPIRIKFLNRLGGLNDGVATARFAARAEKLAQLAKYDFIVLWFEHDLYDQLQLLQAIDTIAGELGRENGLFLVQADDYLIRWTPQTIGSLAQTAKELSADQIGLAREAWLRFRQSTPVEWAELLAADTTLLPYLESSVERLLQDLPAPGTGLARTQLQILDAIENGADQPHKLFRAVQDMEEAHFMGDLSFWRWLDDMTFTAQPLIEGLPDGGLGAAVGRDAINTYLTAPLHLTPMADKVRMGAVDLASIKTIDHWLGGSHITNDNLWRWDRAERKLISP